MLDLMLAFLAAKVPKSEGAFVISSGSYEPYVGGGSTNHGKTKGRPDGVPPRCLGTGQVIANRSDNCLFGHAPSSSPLKRRLEQFGASCGSSMSESYSPILAIRSTLLPSLASGKFLLRWYCFSLGCSDSRSGRTPGPCSTTLARQLPIFSPNTPVPLSGHRARPASAAQLSSRRSHLPHGLCVHQHDACPRHRRLAPIEAWFDGSFQL